MELVDLHKRLTDRRKEASLSELSMDETETLQIEARRILAEEMGAVFAKQYSLTLTSGSAYLYRKTPSTNPDLLWREPVQSGTHSDGTPVSILSPDNCTSESLKFPRNTCYYWGAIDANDTDAILTVWQGDGASAAPDGTINVSFGTVLSLANWHPQLESVLVAKCLELSKNK